MSDAVDQARAVLEDRLRGIDDEIRRLKRALEHLGSSDGAKRAVRKRRSSRSRKPAPRGQRAAEFLAFVKKNPDSRGAEIAKALGVQPSQTYQLAKRLEDEGKVKKTKRGYRLKS